MEEEIVSKEYCELRHANLDSLIERLLEQQDQMYHQHAKIYECIVGNGKEGLRVEVNTVRNNLTWLMRIGGILSGVIVALSIDALRRVIF